MIAMKTRNQSSKIFNISFTANIHFSNVAKIILFSTRAILDSGFYLFFQMAQLHFTQVQKYGSGCIIPVSIGKEFFSPCKLMAPSKTCVTDRKKSKTKGKIRGSRTVLANVPYFTVKQVIY